ncbi:RNA exonuclease Ecym_2636 [Eremothecium cymbalariae DBVPG|uniref:Endonuclease/exonuclease/phosphatase domain-containing protein n=1 Tax=Eremothecium cymbalariae (strain CBS 270.75 / DBVPG 7215 / KCTC 17166 / NRRL Y-17582) TaxID=931890 RepID=G8JNS3_ERECY|nr:Hypothetical protein Ecym_2636 [Eremothecium cymbalariae DBVPG\
MIHRRIVPISKNSHLKLMNGTNNVSSNKTLSVLTYNMLSPYYMWPQVYTYVPDKFKDWNYRHKLLEYELFYKHKADILCLQELTTEDYNQFWRKQMKRRLSYGSNFISKPPPKYWTAGLQEMDGVGTFYNTEKLEFISSTVIYLNDFLSMFSKRELDWMSRRQITQTNGANDPVTTRSLLSILLDRNQVCLFVCLREKDTKSLIVVVNTHLYWKYDEVKLSQCLTIMRKLKQVINKLTTTLEGVTYSQIKIILGGDLNSTRDSLLIKFLNGNIITHGELNLQNSMRPFLSHNVYDSVPHGIFDNTCYSGKLKGIFDYIWFHERDFKLISVLSGKEVSEELSSTGQFGLPNEIHPSDHIPIFIEFEIL